MADKNDLKEVKKPKKEKSGKRRFRRTRETWSELKKVTWPSFTTIVKSTGVVLLVVTIFLLILLAFDSILRFFVFQPLINGRIGGIDAEDILTSAGLVIKTLFGRLL